MTTGDRPRGLRRWSRGLDRSLLPFMGPAQIGAGHEEQPEVRRTDAACPICGAPMDQHEVIRAGDQTRATRLVCPA